MHLHIQFAQRLPMMGLVTDETTALGFNIKRLNLQLPGVNVQLQVWWREGEPDEFPYIWLRDNCQCPACFLDTASSRVSRVTDIPPNARPKEVCVSP